MLSVEEVNALGNILNSTFGKSGNRGETRSLTGSIEGNTLILKFLSVVQFASESSLREQTDRIAEESVKLLAEAVTNIKKQFKEATGNTLKVKEDGSSDSVEVVSGSVHSPRKIAYYRRTHTLSIKE